MSLQFIRLFPHLGVLHRRFFNSYRDGKRVTRNELGDIAEQYKNFVTNRSQKWDVPVLEPPDGRRDDFIDPFSSKPNPIRS